MNGGVEKRITLKDIPGIGNVTLEKLRRVGIISVRQLALYNSDELYELTDIEPYRILKILREARKSLGLKVIKGNELARFSKSSTRLTTGIKGLDNVLEGGLEPRAIYELAGEYGTGKTQLCHQLAVTVQLSENKGGVNGACFYVDTEGTFRSNRITEIAKRFGIDEDYVLQNIYTIRTVNVDHQIEVVRVDAPRLIEENNVKLIIIDSIISHFRAEYHGRDRLAIRQQRLNYMIDWLLRICKLYDVYVVVTNQVMDVPVSWRGGQKIPVGGNIIAHGMTHRLFITNFKGNIKKVKVIDSPNLPLNAEAYFEIFEGGVRDA